MAEVFRGFRLGRSARRAGLGIAKSYGYDPIRDMLREGPKVILSGESSVPTRAETAELRTFARRHPELVALSATAILRKGQDGWAMRRVSYQSGWNPSKPLHEVLGELE